MCEISIKKLKRFLKGLHQDDLLGIKAQLLMAPAMREEELRKSQKVKNKRLSAVLILLFEEDGICKTLMMRRSPHLNSHAGQISFPGGQMDSDDQCPWQTAIRETEEETGIPRDSINMLTQLSDLYIPPSNFNVNVMVGSIHHLPKLIPNLDEVDELLKIPISFFMNEKNIQSRHFKIGEGKAMEAPAYIYGEHIIWGASAMMMSEFIQLIKTMPTE